MRTLDGDGSFKAEESLIGRPASSRRRPFVFASHSSRKPAMNGAQAFQFTLNEWATCLVLLKPFIFLFFFIQLIAFEFFQHLVEAFAFASYKCC